MHISTLADLYLHNHLKSRSSFSTTRRLIRNTFEPLNNILLSAIQPRDVLQWHASMLKTPYQANRALGVLRAMIRWGIRLGFCHYDATQGVRRFPSQSRSRYLSHDEIQRLRSHLPLASAKLRVFILVTLFTGCRRSEALTMKWGDLDLSGGRWNKPKTKSGRFHVVPLSRQLVDLLRATPRESDYVFPGLNGQPWSTAGIEKAWGKFRTTCGLSDVRLHDLRRTTASQMVIHGENLTTVQHVLDHASLQPTAIYARLNITALAHALQRHADRINEENPCFLNATT